MIWKCDRCSKTWDDGPFLVFPFGDAICSMCSKELNELYQDWMKREGPLQAV